MSAAALWSGSAAAAEASVDANPKAPAARLTTSSHCGPPLVQVLVDRYAPETGPIGLAGNQAVEESRKAICRGTGAPEWLPKSCGPLPSPPLPALRAALLTDLVSLARSTLVPARVRSELRPLVAVAETALGDGSVDLLIERLLADGSSPAPACPHGMNLELAALPTLDDSALTAVTLARLAPLSRLAASNVPAPELDAAIDAAVVELRTALALRAKQELVRFEAQTEAKLEGLTGPARMEFGEQIALQKQRLTRVAGMEGLVPSPRVRVAVRSLLSAIQELNAAVAKLDTKLMARALPRLTTEALGIAIDTPNVALDGRIASLLESLLTLRLEASIDVLAAALVAARSPVTIPDTAVKAGRCAVRLAKASTDAERKSVFASCVLGLPPWADPVMLDLAVGAASGNFGDETYNLSGEAMLGYNADRWGIAGTFRGTTFDNSAGGRFSDLWEAGGNLEGWGNVEAGGGVRLEGRLIGSYRWESRTRLVDNGDSGYFEDYDRYRARIVALAGLRYSTPNLAAGVWAGGGGMYETVDPTVAGFPAGAPITLSTIETLEGQVDARIRLTWQFWPQVLAARLRSDFSRFNANRSASTITLVGGNLTVTDGGTLSAMRLDLRSRAFLDLELARLFDFIPGLGVGFDYLGQSGGGDDFTIAAPGVFAGIRRESF